MPSASGTSKKSTLLSSLQASSSLNHNRNNSKNRAHMPGPKPANPFARATTSRAGAPAVPHAAPVASPHYQATGAKHRSPQPAAQSPTRNIHEEMCREWREAEASFLEAHNQRVAARKLQAERDAELKAEREASRAAAYEAHRKRMLEERKRHEQEKREAHEAQKARREQRAKDIAGRAAAQARAQATHASTGATPPLHRQRVFTDDPDNLWGAPRGGPNEEQEEYHIPDYDDSYHSSSHGTYSDYGYSYGSESHSSSQDEDAEDEESFFASWDDGSRGHKAADDWWSSYGNFFNDTFWGGAFGHNGDEYKYRNQNGATGQGHNGETEFHYYKNPWSSAQASYDAFGYRQQAPAANGTAFVSGEHAARAAAAAAYSAKNKSKLDALDEAILEQKIADKVASVVQQSHGDVAAFAAQLKVQFKSLPDNKEATWRSARRAVLLTFHPDKLQQASRKDQLLGLHVTRAINAMK